MKWKATPMLTMKTAKWHIMVPFTSPYNTQADKSMAKPIGLSCGELLASVSLSRVREPFKDHPDTGRHLKGLRNKLQ